MKRLRDVLICLVLAFASAAGAPMRADEVEALMSAMNQPKLAHTLRDEDREDSPVIPEL
jgi:hypothetical protein